jgi:hypothetical protein
LKNFIPEEEGKQNSLWSLRAMSCRVANQKGRSKPLRCFPVTFIKLITLDLDVPIFPSLLSAMTPSTFVLRQLTSPVLRLHFSSSDVRETTLCAEGEPTYRYIVSTSRSTPHSANKATTVSDSRGLPVIVFRWNTYKRDEIHWVEPRQAGPPPVIKRPISAFFKVGR